MHFTHEIFIAQILTQIFIEILKTNENLLSLEMY